MKHIFAIIISVFQLACFIGKAQGLPDSSPIVEKIDNYLNSSVKNGYAGSVLVAKGGDILLSKGYGWADRTKKIPNSPSTVFNIGSVTKQFTAAAILILYQQNKLDTADQIKKFFPEAPKDKQHITIHQLLTHTSGISPRTGGFRYDEASKDTFINEFYSSELMYAPGAKHTYANANYILLAAIVEEVSKQDYESFLRENIWDPVGMHHTGYKRIDFYSEQFAHGYEFEMTKGEWNDWGITQEHLPYSENHWYSIGKGDVYSTVEDLYKWHLALEENVVLKAETKQMMETAFVAENERETSHYGYGWVILKSPKGSKIVTHNGSNTIYFADFIRNVDDGTVIIVLSNILLNRQSGFVGWEIARMISNNEYTPKVLPKNNYELVFRFMRSHEPENANQLLSFLGEESDAPFEDRAVLNRIGFMQVAENLNPEWGIALLELNTEIFPNDGNLWDTLGEAYLLVNNTDKAKESFQKALDLRPEEGCFWCENSEKQLKRLK